MAKNPLRIAVVSGKGGVTKSTIARAIAARLQSKKKSVTGYDMDEEQLSFWRWTQRRKANNVKPAVRVEQAFVMAELRGKVAGCDTDCAVIDTGAYFSSSALQVAKFVDLVVMPTRYTVDDLESLIRVVRGLIKGGVPIEKIIVVFSGVPDSPSEEVETREYLEGQGLTVADGCIRFLKSYGQVQNKGQALTEIKYAGLHTEARTVIDSIINRATELAGKSDEK